VPLEKECWKETLERQCHSFREWIHTPGKREIGKSDVGEYHYIGKSDIGQHRSCLVYEFVGEAGIISHFSQLRNHESFVITFHTYSILCIQDTTHMLHNTTPELVTLPLLRSLRLPDELRQNVLESTTVVDDGRR
jgi:hypothetical protein